MGLFSNLSIDWSPFQLCKSGEKAPYPRGLTTPEGLGDRLRFVAFAEKQASVAFAAAAELFPELNERAKQVWKILADEEAKHLQWLLWRMEELKMDPMERPVSAALWESFDRCKTAHEFATFMKNAEERGRTAGELFYYTLLAIDPITAKIFKQIALEEQEHIRLAASLVTYDFQLPEDFEFEILGIPLEEFKNREEFLSLAGTMEFKGYSVR